MTAPATRAFSIMSTFQVARSATSIRRVVIQQYTISSPPNAGADYEIMFLMRVCAIILKVSLNKKNELLLLTSINTGVRVPWVHNFFLFECVTHSYADRQRDSTPSKTNRIAFTCSNVPAIIEEEATCILLRETSYIRIVTFLCTSGYWTLYNSTWTRTIALRNFLAIRRITRRQIRKYKCSYVKKLKISLPITRCSIGALSQTGEGLEEGENSGEGLQRGRVEIVMEGERERGMSCSLYLRRSHVISAVIGLGYRYVCIMPR